MQVIPPTKNTENASNWLHTIFTSNFFHHLSLKVEKEPIFSLGNPIRTVQSANCGPPAKKSTLCVGPEQWSHPWKSSQRRYSQSELTEIDENSWEYVKQKTHMRNSTWTDWDYDLRASESFRSIESSSATFSFKQTLLAQFAGGSESLLKPPPPHSSTLQFAGQKHRPVTNCSATEQSQ